MAKPTKSYKQYRRMVETYFDFFIAYKEAGPKARKRFQLNERIRILMLDKKKSLK